MCRFTESIHQLHIHAAYWLTIGAGMFIIFMLLGARLFYPGGYPDPFLPYQTIQPGQPITTLKPYDCQTEQFPEQIKMRVCRITVEEDTPFSAILVWTFDGAIQKVTYYGDSLQVVDLIRHFGKPDSVTLYNQHYVLNWNDGTHAVTPMSTRRFAHHMRVMFVILST